jgi:ferredoxin-NADP reductase
VATPWQAATVIDVRTETSRAKTFRLALSRPQPHLAGQHYIVRLTAPDGYTASRSYSVASAPDDSGEVELTVERLPRGEVSVYLHDVAEPGDELEVRGPIGGWFVWRADSPALLVGGGSGVVPLMAMLRHRRRTAPELPMRLVYSVRTPEDVIYADELGDETELTFTRTPPDGWSGHTGRIDASMLADAGGTAFVCGSNGFVEAASMLLLETGFEPEQVRTERFGPTG